MQIPVYKKEYELGLANDIRANSSISYYIQASACDSNNVDITEAFDKLVLPKHVKASKDDFDLFWMNSILVSIGVNKNDDVFDPGEVWRAKDTPVYKKFNFMHDENDIIGHIVASIALDTNGNVVTDTETVPNDYHIAVSSIIWRKWEDPNLQSRIDKLIAEINDGKWFVSMECLFNNFDYLLINPDNSSRIIARNEETSFLSKHLRRYGGDGHYEGSSIARVLRNLTFSGKGLVDNPANTNSIIFREDYNPFKTSLAISSKTLTKTESEKMSENTQLTEALTRAAAAEQSMKDMKDKLEQQVEAAREAEKTKLQESIDTLKASVADLTTKVNDSTKALEAKTSEVDEAKKVAADLQLKLTEAETKIADAEKARVIVARTAQLVEAGADKAKADELVAQWGESNDTQFASIVDMVKAAFPPKMDEKDGKKKEDKKDAKADVTTDENEDTATADVDTDDVDADVVGNVDTTNDVESLRTAAANWLGANVLKSGKKEDK